MIQKTIKRLRRFLKNSIVLLFSAFIRRKSNCVAFGSWCGELYLDNSRYLAEYVRDNRKDLRIYWVGLSNIKEEVESHIPNVVFIKKDSLLGCIKLLRCKYFFFSQMHNADISSYNVFKGATTCYLHHGLCLKKWGQDGLNCHIRVETGRRLIISRFFASSLQYDFFVTSSKMQDATNCTALRFKGCTEEKNLPSGTPRNDMYYDVNKELISRIKNKYASILGFDSSRHVIAYLPTYRRTNTETFSFTRLNHDKMQCINSILKQHNYILLEKSHFAEKNRCNISQNMGNIIGCDKSVNVQELLLFTDLLISDYSGAFLDYLLLDRPIIHFAYDYEYYRTIDSGLYYDIKDFAAGPIAYEYNELIDRIEAYLNGELDYSEKRQYVKDKYMSYEKGRASETIIDTVIGQTTGKNK